MVQWFFQKISSVKACTPTTVNTQNKPISFYFSKDFLVDYSHRISVNIQVFEAMLTSQQNIFLYSTKGISEKTKDWSR